MESSPDDVPMSLRLEVEAVVVFNVMCIWALPWGWFGALASQCGTPGPAFEDPFVRLLSVQFASARNRGNIRRCGAHPNTAQFRPESKRCPNCLGYHPSLFQCGTMFRPLHVSSTRHWRASFASASTSSFLWISSLSSVEVAWLRSRYDLTRLTSFTFGLFGSRWDDSKTPGYT